MKKRRNLIIDLTSLLDVILIILFLVLVSVRNDANNSKKNLESKNEALIAQIDELKKMQQPGTEREKEWYVVYKNQIGKLELNFPKNLGDESLKLVTNDGSEILKPASTELEAWLIEEVKKLSQDVIIISFSYKNDAIYYKDYTATRQILLNLSQKTGKKILYEEFSR